jgi:hypothetical protein
MKYFLAFLLNRILNNKISKILKNAFLSPEIMIPKKINNNDIENSKIFKIFFFNLLKKIYKKNKPYVARKFPAINS